MRTNLWRLGYVAAVALLFTAGGFVCVLLCGFLLVVCLLLLPFVWKEMELEVDSAAQMLLGAPFVCSFLLAPGLALLLALHRFVEDIPYAFPLDRWGPQTVAWFSVGAGAYAAYISIVEDLFREGFWRLRQARQVRNLATSKAAAAALGLAEFRGVARPASGTTGGLLLAYAEQPRQLRLEPFFLQDETGLILVDPRGAAFRGAYLNPFGSRLNEIVLTRHVQKPHADLHRRLELWEDDPVYVVGNVQRKPTAAPDAVDSDALFVGPLEERDETNPLWNLRWGKTLRHMRVLKRGIEHVFFLSDTPEETAHRLILRGLWHTWFRGAIWLAAGLWLVVAELPRTTQDLDHWTVREVSQFARPGERGAELFRRARDTTRRDRGEAIRSLSEMVRHNLPLAFQALEFVASQVRPDDPEVSSLLWSVPRGPYLYSRTPTLLALLKSPNEDARHWAALALGDAKASPEQAVPALAMALRDSYVRVRRSAAWSLQGYGPAAAPASENLIQILEDDDSETRRAAIYALPPLRIPAAVAIPLFRKLLRSQDRELRWGGARGLGFQGNDARPALPDLIAVARDDAESHVRESAVMALGKLARLFPEAIPPVVAALSDKHPRPRAFAVEAVDNLGPQAASAIPSLILLLDKRNDPLVRDAAHALGSIGPAARAALPALEQRRRSEKDDWTRQAFDLAICKIEGRCR